MTCSFHISHREIISFSKHIYPIKWQQKFNFNSDFLDVLCDPLYDHLRPRIIHEIELLKLCELCSLLQTRYMKDPDEGEKPVGLQTCHDLNLSLIRWRHV